MKFIDRVVNKLWRITPCPKANVVIESIPFKIPRIVKHDFYKSSYQSEDWLVRLLLSIHKKKPVNNFIDVGVNVGQTLLKIKSVNPDVNYVGFEPNPYCTVISQQIIYENNLQNCIIVPSGLSDKQQVLKLQIGSENLMDSSASLIEGFRSNDFKESQFVNVLVLDDLWDKLNMSSIDIIKIDIEGGELEAIIGMQKLIKNCMPIIIVEVLPSYSRENEFRIKRQNRLKRLIDVLGYAIYQIKGKDEKLFYERQSEFPIHDNVSESDYILVPNHINLSKINSN